MVDCNDSILNYCLSKMNKLALIKHLIFCILTFVITDKLYSQKFFIIPLGIAQDAGYPHAGCNKKCCKEAWLDLSRQKMVSSLALVDSAKNCAWLFDCTPDFAKQFQLLKQKTNDNITLAGIFLTHAHIGHYTGLMQLGKEVMNEKEIKVYAMPRMKKFLENNGPWSQLVKIKNIEIELLQNETAVKLTDEISVIPMLVPHRDEYSETVGFKIQAKSKSALYIPDIDKWELWNKNILDELAKVDFAFLDATFYSADELPGRNMKEIPHPLVIETAILFRQLNSSTTTKIYLTHFNHTNPLLDIESMKEKFFIFESGLQLTIQGEIINLD